MAYSPSINVSLTLLDTTVVPKADKDTSLAPVEETNSHVASTVPKRKKCEYHSHNAIDIGATIIYCIE